MISKRDVVSALIGAAFTVSLFSAAGVMTAENGSIGSVLGPTVFKWDDMKATKNATGEVRSLVKQPTATVDQLETHITTLNPGQMPHQPHRHVNEELIIMDVGECETLSDGKWIKVGPRDVIFNASNSLHGFRNVGTTAATYHVINWSPNKDAATK